MALQATITGKNQITIPAAIVREMQLEPGMRLEFEVGDKRTLIVRMVISAYELAMQLEGILQDALQPGDDPVGDLIRERVEEDEEHL